MPTAPLMQRDGVTLAEQDGVYTLTMGRGENRINPEMVALLSEALDLVEAAAAPKSLLVSSSVRACMLFCAAHGTCGTRNMRMRSQ
eukprot:COSAG01_NODE_1487_length_10136_cov_8.813390_11_plen_86_part_00